ncbi:MAG: hypothetical protein WD024_06800 [Bacillota bacterium]
MQVLVNGIDRTSVVDLSSLNLDDVLAERKAPHFVASDKDGTLGGVFVEGVPVRIVHEGAAVFGGEVDHVDKIRPARTGAARVYAVDCVGWEVLGDRHVVAETYTQVLAGAIVRDLVDKYLATDGVTYTVESVQNGPAVTEAVFNYVKATPCFDTLAERAGFSWWIDGDKVIYFCERATYRAPWDLNDPDLVNDLQLHKSREGYRNRQYIKAGKDVTDSQVESFKGDGVSRTFTVGFPMAHVPAVTVNGVAKIVGIKGIDTDKDWYWNKGDAVLTQDQAAVALAATDTLAITYQGFFDVVILTTDEAAIEGRKVIEGGSGWYESVEDEPYLSSREAAIQSGNAKLRRYAKMPESITFNTWHPGLRAGQILSVNLPEEGLVNKEYLIDQVAFSRIGKRGTQPEYWRYDVKAVSGEALGGWARFFRNMATRGQAFVIRENIREDQVLIYLVQASESWRWAENTTITVNACPIPSAALYPSATLYPC